MLIFDNVSYSYNARIDALHNISTEISPGVCLLLGANGAGKSTLLSLAASTITARTGTVTFDDKDLALRLPSVLQKVFFLPDSYRSPFRTVRDMVKRMAPFYPNFDAAMLEENLAAFGLTGNEALKRLSLGNTHKSYIAFALALRTEVLLLDEPANGLDITSKKELRRMISRCISNDQTLIIATHTVADLEMLYDRLLILRNGALALSVTTEEISAKLSFVNGPSIPDRAIYHELDGGIVRAIVPAEVPYSTAVDFELLYTAISEGKDEIISKILVKNQSES